MLRYGWLLGSALSASGCAAPEPPPVSPTPPVPTEVRESSGALATAEEPSPISLVPIERGPAPSIESAPKITSPADSSVLAGSNALDTPVVVEGGSWLAGHPDRKVALVLDRYRVRYLKSRAALSLRDLVPADRALDPGTHRLVAILVDERGVLVKTVPDGILPFAAVRFGVDRAPSPRPQSPEIVYVEPQGTYNGDAAADSARLDFYVLDAPAPPLRIGARIDGRPPVSGAMIDPGNAYGLAGLTNGDHTIELAFARGTDPSAWVGRTITVNRELSPE